MPERVHGSVPIEDEGLRRLAKMVAHAYADEGAHDTRAAEIREQLLAMHRRQYGDRHAGVVETPLGWVGVFWSARGVRGVILPQPTPDEALARIQERCSGCTLSELPPELSDWLRDYFAGRQPGSLPALDLDDLPPFRRRVLELTASIPPGQTRTYQWLAAELGTKAYQAVGQALGANPVPILIPCHRVVASDGSMRGYIGGVDLKRRLLAIEQAI